MKTIEEGNKLIAEFMGGKKNNISDIYYLPEFGHYFNSYGQIEWSDCFRLNELKYHTSWDWLMPVVEKIESFDHISVDMTKGYCRVFKCYNFEDRYRHGNQLAFSSDTPKIQAVWSACVEFIDWFNNH